MSSSQESTNTVQENIEYVRSAVVRQDYDPAEFNIAIILTFVNLIGLSLYDWSYIAGGVFWIVALPVFGIGTGWYASRVTKNRGEIDRALGRRHALHWTSIPLFLFFSNIIIFTNRLPEEGIGQIMFLVIAMVYYLGGVHFWRGYLWAGLAMASGILWLALLDRFAFTLTGSLTFVVLAGSALRYRYRHAAQK